MPERLIYLLSRVQQRLTTHIKRSLKSEGLSLSQGQMGVLVALGQLGETTMGQLSEALGTDNAALTRVVDTLEARRLVQRRINARDRRQVLIQTTEGGAQQAKTVKRIVKAANRRILEGLSAEDLAAFERVNAAILEKFS